MNKKHAYENKLENQLHDWNLEYFVLHDLVDRIEADSESGLNDAMSYLREKRAVAMHKLQELKNADDEEWEGLQDDIDSAWSNLGIAIKSVEMHLKS